MSNTQSNEPLQNSLSRLSPDVFCHPVWVNFAAPKAQFSRDLVEDLLQIAEQLEIQHNPMDACQVQLICAVLQSRSGDHIGALTSIEAAWSLAERHNLPQVACWAAWGASSFCAHQGHYQQAAGYLERLQVELAEHNEWILSNIVATVRQTLLESTSVSPPNAGASLSLPPQSTLSIALDQLLHWGESHPTVESPHQKAESNGRYNGHSFALTSAPRVLAQDSGSFRDAAKRPIQDMSRSETRVDNEHPFRTIQPSLNPPIYAAPGIPFQRRQSPTRAISFSLDPPLRPEPSPPPIVPSGQARKELSLTVYCLGTFRVYVNERPIEKWPGNKCKSIFKYMIIHRDQPIHREILMDLFWRDVDPEAARRNLYQAIYNLRQAFQNGGPDIPYILCEDSCYRLNPDLDLWVDSEAFDLSYQTGQRLERGGRLPEAIREYELAENLYGGEFLAEDVYEDWPLVHRENLKHAYLDALDRLSKYFFDAGQLAMCIAYCHKILAEDSCREDTHRRLMCCYSKQGQRHLALRQYHTCVEALERELEVPPMPATVELYQQIQENLVQFSGASKLSIK